MLKSFQVALATVLIHLASVALHGTAHVILGVWQTPAQNLYIVTVIYIAPLVAAWLLWRGATMAGSLTLALSMLGSLIFGAYYHFIANTPDHVAHVAALTPAAWASIFRWSAQLNAVIEAAGSLIGLMLLSAARPPRGSARSM